MLIKLSPSNDYPIMSKKVNLIIHTFVVSSHDSLFTTPTRKTHQKC